MLVILTIFDLTVPQTSQAIDSQVVEQTTLFTQLNHSLAHSKSMMLKKRKPNRRLQTDHANGMKFERKDGFFLGKEMRFSR